jgi:hypothetical protein
VIATIDPKKMPGIDRCIEWFETKFAALPPTDSVN